jgi:hypothetical protein
MKDLKNMELSKLTDLLAGYTDAYLQMLKDGTTESEFSECKMKIDSIVREINSRTAESMVAR